MFLQGIGVVLVVIAGVFWGWLGGVILLGVGTGLAYPVLIAAAGDTADRHASRIGAYRFWRDLGFVGGTLFIGQLADRFGTLSALDVLAGVGIASGIIAAVGLTRRPKPGSWYPSSA